MARIKNPPKFADKSKLFKKMKSIIDLEGSTGPCVVFMGTKGIVLSDDLLLVEAADGSDANRIQFDSDGIVAHRKCFLMFNPPWKIVTKGVQYLKPGFEPNMDLLKDWAIPVEGGVRIEYPSDFTDRTNILYSFYVKHATYPGITSPLNGYIVQNSIIPAQEVLGVTQAVTQYNLFTSNAANSVTQTSARKVAFATPWKHVLQLQNFLMQLNAADPFINRKYGFNVVDSKAKAKETKSSLLPEEIKKYGGVVVGSTVYNDSTGVLNLQQGKKATAKVIVIPPGGTYVVLKGGTFLVITNPSSTLTVKFRLTKTK